MAGMWRSAVLVISIGLLVAGCAGKEARFASEGEVVLPEWFWRPPISGSVPIAVGYSPSYLNPRKAIASAEENGVENLAKQIVVRIRGERVFHSDGRGTRFMGEKIEEIVPEEIVDALKEKHILLDAFVSKGCTVALVSTAKVPISKRRVGPGKRPKWIDHLPQEEGFLYARGQSQMGILSLIHI